MNRFAADPSAIRGAITPLITPFHADGVARPRDASRALVDWQLDARLARDLGRRLDRRADLADRRRADRGDARRRRARSTAASPSCPAPARARLDETLELTAEAQRLGASGALVVSPYYARPQQDGPLRLVRARRAASSPTSRSSSTTSRSARRSTSRPRPSGALRRAPRRTSSASRRRRATSSTSPTSSHECGSDFIALSGIELLCYPMLVLGGRGHLSCVANFAPRAGRRALRRVRRRRPRPRARAALRAARARRRRLRRGQPGAGEVDHARARDHAVGVRARAARAAQRRLGREDPRAAAGALRALDGWLRGRRVRRVRPASD